MFNNKTTKVHKNYKKKLPAPEKLPCHYLGETANAMTPVIFNRARRKLPSTGCTLSPSSEINLLHLTYILTTYKQGNL